MRFPVLNIMGSIVRGVGWLIVVLGVIFFIYGLVQLTQGQAPTFEPYSRYAGLVPLLIGLYAFVSGIVVVALGESMLVLLAIEENTRTTPVEPAAQLMQLLVAIERNTRRPQGAPNTGPQPGSARPG